jgi:hypothetical protein
VGRWNQREFAALINHRDGKEFKHNRKWSLAGLAIFFCQPTCDRGMQEHQGFNSSRCGIALSVACCSQFQ